MPSQDVFDLIDESIQVMRDCESDFTAYDITKTVRLSTDEEFFHGEVRQYIHQVMENYVHDGIYTKELDTNIGAYKYNFVKSAINNLESNILKTQSTKLKNSFDSFKSHLVNNLSIVKAKLHNLKDNLKDIDISKAPFKYTAPQSVKFNITKRDKRGRLCIPKSALEKCNFKSFETLYVTEALEQNAVLVVNYLSSNTIGSTSIDKSGNIRLSPQTLLKAGIKTSDPVEVEVLEDTIVVKV